MATYLIVADTDDGTFVNQVEARNMKEAARTLVGGEGNPDGFTARIWRVTGPPKTVTLRVETSLAVDVSDAGEDQ